MRIKSFPHKPEVNIDDWDKVHKNLVLLSEFLIDFCLANKLPVLVTSIIRPKINGVSVSKTHQEGRAFDISVNGWGDSDIEIFVDSCNEKMNIGAISFSDGKEREAIFEDDVFKDDKQIKWKHIHLQVRA